MYYKFLNQDLLGPYSNAHWPLPTPESPGEWLEVSGELVMCENGLHVCEAEHLLSWIDYALFEVEVDGERLDDQSQKICARRARLVRRVESWNPSSARLFAADCAEHVLSIFENTVANDDRPRLAIAAAREFGDGNAASATSAWEAADAASSATPASPARAAVSAARAAATATAAWAADAAAWAADAAAATSATSATTARAAWAAERAWQLKSLLKRLGIDAPSDQES